MSLLNSVLFLVQLLNVAWIMSFDKDYPTIHKLWILKNLIYLFFLVATFNYELRKKEPKFILLLPIGLILTQFVLWRSFCDKKSSRSLKIKTD